MPAIGAAGYTVATVNNSFDKSLHGLMGFLDSPVSISNFVVLEARRVLADKTLFLSDIMNSAERL